MLIPFLREKPASVLLVLRNTNKNWHISSISKETGMTYLHTLNVLSQYYNLGIIDYKVQGRKKFVVLTEKGKAVAAALNQLVDTLKEEK